MYQFILNNRDALIDRCRDKVAGRAPRRSSPEQISLGIPLFLDQLARTLAAEERGEDAESIRISGASGGNAYVLSEMGVGAAAHGKVLLALGFSIDQVVHDYGDLCQSITDLAVERDAPFSIDEFRTLNRCLDNAIADAVTAFTGARDATVARQVAADQHQRLGSLVHESRNYLQAATMAYGALESGRVGIGGSTSGLLKRSLDALSVLLTDSVAEIKRGAEPLPRQVFSVGLLIADAETSASLYAETRGCTLTVTPVDPVVLVSGNRVLLAAALVNLLQNAFKFTRPHTGVMLSVHTTPDHVTIAVQDQCGGLPAGATDLFMPFSQSGADRSGLGLGLSIARRSVEADGGTLRVRDLPGVGCVFTIDLPRYLPV